MRAELTAAMDRVDATDAKGLLSVQCSDPFRSLDDGTGLSLKRLRSSLERGAGKSNPSKRVAQHGQENLHQRALPFASLKSSAKPKSLTMQLEASCRASRCKRAAQQQATHASQLNAAPLASHLPTATTFPSPNFPSLGLNYRQLPVSSHFLQHQASHQGSSDPTPLHHVPSLLQSMCTANSTKPVSEHLTHRMPQPAHIIPPYYRSDMLWLQPHTPIVSTLQTPLEFKHVQSKWKFWLFVDARMPFKSMSLNTCFVFRVCYCSKIQDVCLFQSICSYSRKI